MISILFFSFFFVVHVNPSSSASSLQPLVFEKENKENIQF